MFKFLLSAFVVLIITSCFHSEETNRVTPVFYGVNETPKIDLEYINKCVSKSHNFNLIEVNRKNYSRCSLGNEYYNGLSSIDTKYKLSVDSGFLKVDLGMIYFFPPRKDMTTDANGDEIYYRDDTEDKNNILIMKSIIESKKEEVDGFFKKHGIKFTQNYTFLESSDGVDTKENIVIHLSNGSGRSNSGFWILGGENITGLIIHEFGHWLGLPDRYSEVDKCSERDTIVDNMDIMNAHFQNLQDLAFNKFDIQSIVQPYCELESNYRTSLDEFIAKDLFFEKKDNYPIDDYSSLFPMESVNSQFKILTSLLNIENTTCNVSDDDNLCSGILSSLQRLVENSELVLEGVNFLSLYNKNYYSFAIDPIDPIDKPIGIYSWKSSNEGWDQIILNFDLGEIDLTHICAKIIVVEGFERCNITLNLDISNNVQDIQSALIEAENLFANYNENFVLETKKQLEIHTKLEEFGSLFDKPVKCPDMNNMCLDALNQLNSLFSENNFKVEQEYIVLVDGEGGNLDYVVCEIDRGLSDIILLKESSITAADSAQCFDALLVDYSATGEEVFSQLNKLLL